MFVTLHGSTARRKVPRFCSLSLSLSLSLSVRSSRRGARKRRANDECESEKLRSNQNFLMGLAAFYSITISLSC